MMSLSKWVVGVSLLCTVSGSVAQVRINEMCAVATDRVIRWDEAGRARIGAGINWYDSGFDTTEWTDGTGPIGMGTEVATDLQSLMVLKTPSVYMRKNFTSSELQATGSGNLIFEVEYTDGFVAYLNGEEIARKNAGAAGAPFMHDQLAFNGAVASVTGFENTVWNQTLTLDTASALLVSGTNVLAIQAHDNDMYLEDSTLYCKAVLKTSTGQVLARYDGDWQWFVGRYEPSGGVVDFGVDSEALSPLVWTEITFDDTSWPVGAGHIGYDRNALISPFGTDLEGQLDGITGSLYLRTVFAVSDTTGTLEFSVDYDDGFVAYLNGVEIARRLAGDSGVIVPHDSFATAYHNEGTPEIISLGAAQDWLVSGENVLAIHSLNGAITSSDQFMIPNLYTVGGETHVQATDTSRYFVGTEEPVQPLEESDDTDSDFLDWLELKNTSSSPVSLAGWSLTDDVDKPDQWIFPEITIPAGGVLLVACSGKNLRDPAAPMLHTSFSLGRDGEYVGIYNASGTLISEIASEYPLQHPFFSYGWDEASAAFRYFVLPTPGAENQGDTFAVFPEPPAILMDSGFYDGSLSVAITSSLASASIYYTTDGSEPNLLNGTLYNAPLSISANTALRAAVVNAEGIASEPSTRTFLMNIPAVLKSLPAVVLTSDEERGLYKPYGVTSIVGGEYKDVANNAPWYPTSPDDYNILLMHGRPFERRACLELFEAGTNLWVQADCGIKLATSTWTRPRLLFNDLSNTWYGDFKEKPQFNVILRKIYGDESVKNHFFENSALKNIEQFRIRPGKNDSLDPFIKDEFARRLYVEMGRVGSVGALAGLWVNGQFRCYYNPVERYCEAFYQEYFNSDQEWDALSHEYLSPEGYGVYEGDDVAFRAMFDFIENNDLSSAANYQQLTGMLDPENFADYILFNTYFATWDWHWNNWHISRERSINGRFRYHVWDAEGIFQRGNDYDYNVFTETDYLQGDHYIGKLYRALAASDEFAIMMQDRIAEQFFNGGPLEDAHMQTRYEELAGELDPMMNYIRATSVTRDKANAWIANRRPEFFKQLSEYGYWQDISRPAISPDSTNFTGQIEITISHTNSSGVIYYTLDGSDPRAPGGTIHGSPYSAPIELSQSSQVKARVLKDGIWGPIAKIAFPKDNTDLLLTEVHYNPAVVAGEDTEFVEFQNTGTEPLSLDGFGVDGGIEFEFGSETLAPGAHVVVVRDLIAFAEHYATNGLFIAGEYAGKLSNSGEEIRLEFLGKKLFEVAYNEARGWPAAADGGGPSLVPNNSEISTQGFDIFDYPGNWRASTYNGGSPGTTDPEPLPGLVLNEITAHTDTGNPVPYESNDQIELYNPTASEMVLDGNWYLSDDLDETKQWNIPAGTPIPAGGWVVFDEDDFHADRISGFGLDKAGEWVVLSHQPGSNLDRVVDCIKFEGQANDDLYSWGRYPDGDAYLQTLARTPNAANRLLSSIGVRIQAFMYNPKPLDLYDANEVLEFIMLTNGAPDSLSFIGESVTNTWRLNGGIDYSFEPGTSMEAGEILWVVPFDPALEPEKKSIFCATYGINATSARLVGPWKGDLSNSGERVTLEKAQASDDLLAPEEISWITVDEIIWLDEAPWPAVADGTGRPLLRTGSAGNDPASWMAPSDFDADELPDAWELSLRPDLSDLGKGDFDGDGQSDWEEFIAGTVPLDAASFFLFRCTPLDGDYLLNWDSVSGRVYGVYWSTNLHLPFILFDEAPYPANSYEIDFNGSDEAVFFRVGVWTNAVPSE